MEEQSCVDQKTQLLVIGSGPGGYVAAIRAAQLGKSVLLVDKSSKLGGCCLNEGCIPSKALLESSKLYSNILSKAPKHGISVTGVALDFAQLMARKEQVLDTNRKGLQFLMKKNQIQVVTGQARLGRDRTAILTVEEVERTIHFEDCILATGSSPSFPPGFEPDGKQVITSREALSLENVPMRLLILGAGVIGLELGTVYARLGAAVEIVEMKDRPLPEMDGDVSKEMTRCLKKQKLKLHLSSRATGLSKEDGKLQLTMVDKKGKELILEGDLLLVATGRKPYAAGLGLEELGIELTDQGAVQVNERLETAIPHVYAIGDLIGGAMLAHKASEEGIQAAEIICGTRANFQAKPIPSVIYTSPEAAGIGKTEEQLLADGIAYSKGHFPLRPLGRSLASGELDGFAKVLADQQGKILGIHLVGERATDLIGEAALALEHHLTLEQLEEAIHPHPSYSESIKEAALHALGRAHHL